MNRDQIQRLAVLAIETQDSVLLEHAVKLLRHLGQKDSLPRYMRTNYSTGMREYSYTPDFKEIASIMKLSLFELEQDARKDTK